MRHEILLEALNHISDKHIAEAANAKKHRLPVWSGAVAAVLAAAVLLGLFARPLTLSAQAVSVADYPRYQWQYRQMEGTVTQLQDFFTASMRQTLSGETDNQAYSPANLYMALCLMAELSESDQILSVLHTENTAALRAQANEFWNACYRDDGDQTLLANSLWLDEGLGYDQSVMDTLAGSYYTSVYQRDLQNSGTGQAIRTWLDQQTGNMLQAETGQLEVAPETLLLLYSTVYYQAKWSDSYEFRSSDNTAAKFHAPGGDVTCTFMNKDELETNYYWAENFGAVALGLKDGSQMWLLLPDEDKSVDDVLASSEFSQLLFGQDSYENTKYMKVNLSVPQFDIRASGDLKEDLQALGITEVFTCDTGLSNAVFSEDPLFFTNVNQATRVAIDEKGVTAASYIELPGAGAAAPPEEIIDFILDRPFVFVITNRYDIPLFAGIVNEP